MFDIVRSLQKVKTQVLRSSKRRSFSAATNLKDAAFGEKKTQLPS